MRNIICLIVLAGTISFSLSFCDRADNGEHSITDIDVMAMAQKHLAEFSFIRERPLYDFGTEYVFARERDSVTVFITIGLYQQEDEALNAAISYMDDISLVMEEGNPGDRSTGDAFWWWAPGPEKSIITNIIFVRTNALIIMSAPNFDELEALAVNIDNDILNKASYITFDT
jgi:hypothetical protein